MRETPPQTPAEAPPSDRVVLARIAIGSALKVDGVAEPHLPPVGRRSTRSGGVRVDGVTVTASPGGGYDVALHLVARVVPLQALGERVRSRVEGAARRAGLAERLGPVSVRFEDLVEPAASRPAPAPPPVASPPAPFPGPVSP